MTRPAARGTLLALASVVTAGCSSPNASEASRLDGAVVDAAPGESDATEGGGIPYAGEDSGNDGDAEIVRCTRATDGGQDGTTNVICSTEACLDTNWAQWPMPNNPVDVANGGPNLESYTANGDGTVTDNVTGLMWQQVAPPGVYSWSDAQTYCANLALATHIDWRLPTFVELVSIIDSSQAPATINLTAFPGAPGIDFWTSTLFAGTLTDAREVYFNSGDTGQDGVLGTNNVRCARGPASARPPAVPPARYMIDSGTVYDNETSLTWQQTVPSQTFAWADAKAYCANLSRGGAGSWRLPTAKELLTLVDVARPTVPVIDCEAFPDTPADDEWSATPFGGSSTNAWAVYFYSGYPISRAVSSLNFVRCVQ